MCLWKGREDDEEALAGEFLKAHVFTTARHDAPSNWDYTGKSVKEVLKTIGPMMKNVENIVLCCDGAAGQNWSPR